MLATDPDDQERRRMGLLFDYHSALTINMLGAAGVSNGWRCLEVGAGGGGITSWLAERVCPDGRVVAVDLETRWLDPLAGDVVTVLPGDFTQLEFEKQQFDLVVAQMLLLHLPNPQEVCQRFVDLTAPNGQIVIHDADFSPLTLADATETEAKGLAVMVDVMKAAGVHTTLGPAVASMLEAAGATIEQIEEQPCETPDDERRAKEITATTIERFRGRASAPVEAIDAAQGALADDSRHFVGPTRWGVRARRNA